MAIPKSAKISEDATPSITGRKTPRKPSRRDAFGPPAGADFTEVPCLCLIFSLRLHSRPLVFSSLDRQVCLFPVLQL